jgi:hypothetical protein
MKNSSLSGVVIDEDMNPVSSNIVLVNVNVDSSNENSRKLSYGEFKGPRSCSSFIHRTHLSYKSQGFRAE